jgi:7-alpha-hydroxysteroid dehydrogenase
MLLEEGVAIVTGSGRGSAPGLPVALRPRGATSSRSPVAPATLRRSRGTCAPRGGRRRSLRPTSVTPRQRQRSSIAPLRASPGLTSSSTTPAGRCRPRSETRPADLERAFRLNVVSAFELTRLATPRLLESDRAAVTNISSRMDRLVARRLLTYGTVKAALSHLTRLLAVELAPRVRVNGIAPGAVATEALERALGAEARRQIEVATPLHRLATVGDVADVAAWLASARASYITGKIIDLDGGAEWPIFPDDSPDLRPPGRG